MDLVPVPRLIDIRHDEDGLPVVTVTLDLAPPVVDAGLHALRTIREARYVTQAMTTDEALALRELTALIDELAPAAGAEGILRLDATVARTGILRDAVGQFLRREHLEREGDHVALPVAAILHEALEDAHAEGVEAVLGGASHARR
jgi:hypothetical protein